MKMNDMKERAHRMIQRAIGTARKGSGWAKPPQTKLDT